MKKIFSTLIIAALMGGAPAISASATETPSATESQSAYEYDTPNMEGTVGKYNIVMYLVVNEGKGTVSGWYYYKSKGSKNKISLSGTIQGDPIGEGATVKVSESVNGKKTGTFSGDLWISATGSAGYEGTWTSPAGKKLKFEVEYMRP